MIRGLMRVAKGVETGEGDKRVREGGERVGEGDKRVVEGW